MTTDIDILDQLETAYPGRVAFNTFPQSFDLLSNTSKILLTNLSTQPSRNKDLARRDVINYRVLITGKIYANVIDTADSVIELLDGYTSAEVYNCFYDGDVYQKEELVEAHTKIIDFIVYRQH